MTGSRQCGPLAAEAFAALTLLCGCAGSPAPAETHLATATITIGDAGPAPGADVDVPQFGTIVFKSGVRGGDLQIRVNRPYEPSEPCATTLGFQGVAGAAVADAVAPGGIVSLCFHTAGDFEYVARSGSREWTGVIHVRGAGR